MVLSGPFQLKGESNIHPYYLDSKLPFAHCIVSNGPQASWSRAASETVSAEDDPRAVRPRVSIALAALRPRASRLVIQTHARYSNGVVPQIKGRRLYQIIISPSQVTQVQEPRRNRAPTTLALLCYRRLQKF